MESENKDSLDSFIGIMMKFFTKSQQFDPGNILNSLKVEHLFAKEEVKENPLSNSDSSKASYINTVTRTGEKTDP